MLDFYVDVAREGEIRVLQITDMQTIDADQRRFPDRIGGWKLTEWVRAKNEQNLYCYIRELVQRTQPDLILITGDIIYGEFDDAGTSTMEFIEVMDSFGIPWAPIFGNHDNETYKGIDWQCEQYTNAKHALFARGTVFGNSNYSIGIRQNGELQRVICMMDSNGCGKLKIEEGLRDDQIAWLEQTVAENDVPAFVCMHIPTRDFYDALMQSGYQETPDTHDHFASFEIGKTVPARAGDFGKKNYPLYENDASVRLLPLCKKYNIDGVFVGHYHCISTSIAYEGVRFTFGLKTGVYDSYDPEHTGGTLIRLNGKAFTVNHEPCVLR